MDDTYQAYVNRVARMTLPDSYKSQVEHIQESTKFKPDEAGVRVPVPFPGYSVITPPAAEDLENAALYTNLQSCQQRLLHELSPGSLVALPPDSFHLTLADLIWNSAYRDVTAQNPKFEGQLRSQIADCFVASKPALVSGSEIRWIVLGYFGDIGPNLERERLCTLVNELNDQWLDTPQELVVHRAELRKFDDMMSYYREPDWPVLEF